MKNRLKLRIESNGTARGTRVFDDFTGLEIKGVSRVDWFATADGRCKATIEVNEVALHYKGICEFEKKEVDGGKVS